MRKVGGLIAVVAVIFAVVIGWRKLARAETVTGQLVDLYCYAENKALTGSAHPRRGLICAQACAREGFAVGLLTTDGKVYQVAGTLAANNNAMLVPHMSHTVSISGDVSQKD